MNNDSTATLTVFAGMIAVFFGFATLMLKQATKDRDADRKDRKELSNAIQSMAKSGLRQAEATERSADEAKQRNGHLAELVTESTKTTQTLAENGIANIIATVHATQKVNTQQVEHQIVKEQIKKSSL